MHHALPQMRQRADLWVLRLFGRMKRDCLDGCKVYTFAARLDVIQMPEPAAEKSAADLHG